MVALHSSRIGSVSLLVVVSSDDVAVLGRVHLLFDQDVTCFVALKVEAVLYY